MTVSHFPEMAILNEILSGSVSGTRRSSSEQAHKTKHAILAAMYVIILTLGNMLIDL